MKEPHHLRTLVIEDNPDDAELMIQQLHDSGYECRWKLVQDPAGFEAALAAEEWDVILSDFNLPRFNAPAALALLKASGKDIPFIIVSGSVGEIAAVQAMKAGAHDFFAKSAITRLGAAIDREVREAKVRHERRDALAELEQAVRARDEFLSIASHELKTPLTSMELQLESLERLAQASPNARLSDEKIVRKLSVIHRQTEQLSVLVNSLLDVTRITSGRIDLRPEPVDLAELARSIARRMQDPLDRSGSTLELRAPNPVKGSWDRERLDTIVTNLLSNAIKYGNGKPIEVRVEAEGDKARLCVSDNGIGISPEEQARIFERFERAVPEAHYGGFGLGLWIVRQIALAHGGSVRVQSRVAQGSTFMVELPLA